MAMIKPDTTDDSLLGGRLRLRQSARGHRVGTDALLLAAVTPPDISGIILDVGAGSGAVGLIAALRAPKAQVGLVEIDQTACALALANIAANEFSDRVRVYSADILTPASRRQAGLDDERAALVLSNPPFFAPGSVRASPDRSRARAHVAAAPLTDWGRACLALLAPGGVFAMIHRADALADCLDFMDRRLGGISIRPVHPRAGGLASRVLLRGVKGSRAPLRLEAPLVLHEADGRFTPEAMRLGLDTGSTIFSTESD